MKQFFTYVKTEFISRLKSKKSKFKGVRYAFTLAEVLITLGIIGVVAAMTIPTIVANHQKHITINKLKKVYSTLSNMLINSYADNGPVTNLTSGESVNSNKTKQFFETYWFPYFIEPIVIKSKFYETTLPFKYADGSNIGTSILTDYSAGRVLFSTQDGMIYYVHTMTWEKDENGNMIATYLNPIDVMVDINGVKQPNTYGKDIFLFSINFDNNVVRPRCYNLSPASIDANCSKGAKGACCVAKIIKDGWQIAPDYPW